jgi:hypothetical protein
MGAHAALDKLPRHRKAHAVISTASITHLLGGGAW